MSAWNAKYSDEQRAAIELAALDLRIRPLARIAELASAGQLRATPNGEALPPFEIPASTVVSMKSKMARRRAGLDLPGDLAKLPPRDRAEQMQRRLTALVDREITRLETAQAKKPKDAINAEQARKIARALRELGTLPDPHEKRLPRTPGERDGGAMRPDSPTADSLAGKLLAASDKSRAPSMQTPQQPTPPQPTTSFPTQDDTATTATHHDTHHTHNTPPPHQQHATHHDQHDTSESCSGVDSADCGLTVDSVVVARGAL